jgi:hypothetical protein
VLSEKPLEGLTTHSPVELYESLTGKSAPKELIDASQIEEEVVSSEEEENDEAVAPGKLVYAKNNTESLLSPTFSLNYTGKMSAEDFVYRYGRVYGDGADYFWTDVVGSGWAMSKSYNVSTDLVTNRGIAIHIIKAKKNSFSSWKTKYSQVVPIGYHSYYMYGTNKKRKKKCIIEEPPESNGLLWYHVKITFNK